MTIRKHILNPQLYDAVLFDLDGVVTRTSDTHARAWKELFDGYLKTTCTDNGTYDPFDLRSDYLSYVDGKPRNAGVKDFLSSRSIDISYGSKNDSPDLETICGLGNKKNQIFSDILKMKGYRFMNLPFILLSS